MTKYIHHTATSKQIECSSGLELTTANIDLIMNVLPREGSSHRVKFIRSYLHNIEPLQDFTLYCIKKGRATRHFFFIHNTSHQIVILPPYTVRANKHSLEDHLAWIAKIKAPEIIQQNLAKIQEIPPSASAGNKPVSLVPQEKKSSIEEKEEARPQFEPNLAARKKIEYLCDYMYSQTRDKSKTYSPRTYSDWLDGILRYIDECPLPCYFEKDGKYLKLVIMQYDNEQNHIVGNHSDFLGILEGKDFEKLTLRQQHCFLRSLTITSFSEKIFQLTGKGLEREFVKSFLKVVLVAIENGSLEKSDPRLYRWIDDFLKKLGNKSFAALLTQEMALNLFKHLYGYFLESKKEHKERNDLREILSYFLPFLIEEEVFFIFRSQLPAADVIWFIEKIEFSLICSTVAAVLDWVVALEGTKESEYRAVLFQLNEKVRAALTDAQRAVIGSLVYNRLICKGIAVEKYKMLFDMAEPFNQGPTATQTVKPQARRPGPSTANIPVSSDYKQQGPRRLIARKGQPPTQQLGLKYQISLQIHYNRIGILKQVQKEKWGSGSVLNLSPQVPQEIGSFFAILSNLPAGHPLEKNFYTDYIEAQCFLMGAGKYFNAIEYCLYKQEYEVVARLAHCYSKYENATVIFKDSFDRILQLIFEQMLDVREEHNNLPQSERSSAKNVLILIGRFFETLSKLPEKDPLQEKFLKRFYEEYVLKKPYHVQGSRYINAIEYCLLRKSYKWVIHMYGCYKDYEGSANIFQQVLHIAIAQTDLHAVQICLNTFGCDPNKDKGLFAECCSRAAQWQNKAKEKTHRLLDIIKLLVQAGGDPYRCRKEEEVDGFGPSLLDMVVSNFDIGDCEVRNLVEFLKMRGISHVTGPEICREMGVHFLDPRIRTCVEHVASYMRDPSNSEAIKEFLTDNPEFINFTFRSEEYIACPIIFIAIWHNDEALLRFLLENFSPYLGKRDLTNSFFKFENDIVSPLEAAVYAGFYTGVEMLLAYGATAEVAANIRSKASEEILSLVNAHSDYSPQQMEENRSNNEAYSPFWSTLSRLALTSPETSEAEDEMYSGFTPMAMCRIV